MEILPPKIKSKKLHVPEIYSYQENLTAQSNVYSKQEESE